MRFRRGQDVLFTTEELLAGFRLILDEPTARRAVYEWLDTFGFCVAHNCVMEPAGGWEEYGGGADVDPSVAGSIQFLDPAKEFLETAQGAPVVDDLSPLIRAMFVRYSDMHYFLVAMATPSAVARLEAAGIDLSGLPQTPEARDDFLAPIRRMSGL
jgi:hypothetical protein